jgi:cation transport protein ChaC
VVPVQLRKAILTRVFSGYSAHHTNFHPSDGSNGFKTLVYIGTPDNEQFTGPQDPQKLAEHIHRSVGPSGPNIDYLLSLEAALDNLSVESGDEHIKDLANRVRMIQAELSQKQALNRELETASSTDEQEEIEKPDY